MDEMDRRFREAVAEVLKVAPEQINDESSPKTVPSWDSLNHLLLVAHLETVFDTEMTTEEVVGIGCIADLRKILEAHGVRF
ncbi:MAG: acyl carrier protein [Candidatus Rokubacteria bacterium]|nr:acyl carrier protein [Candidatus Rokubacteria bacterium]